MTPFSQQGVAGLTSFEALAWWGVIAPATTPPALVKRMNEELVKALKVPALADKLSAQGIDLLSSSPAQMDAFMKTEIERWAKVVKDNKIKAGD